MEALDGIFVSLLGQRQREHGGFALCMAHGTLHGAEVVTSFEQMGGRGMPEGRGADVSLADTGALCGFAKSALDAAAGQRGGGAGVGNHGAARGWGWDHGGRTCR